MNPADLLEQLSQTCPLCNRPPQTPVGGTDDTYEINCGVCSRYRITKEVLLFENLTPEAKSQLSAVVRRHFDYTQHPETITTMNCRELASAAPAKNDVIGKVRYLLRYIARKSHFPGERVNLKGETDYPVCFAASVEEFRYYAQYIVDAGFADGQRMDMHGECQYCLTPKGWKEVERIPMLESPCAFVAMSFSKEGHYGALLNGAYEEAITELFTMGFRSRRKFFGPASGRSSSWECPQRRQLVM